MSAQKMPDVPVALHLVAIEYANCLNRHFSTFPADDGTVPRAPYEPGSGRNGPTAFRDLSYSATRLLDMFTQARGEDDDRERSAILFRVRTNSRQIAASLEALQAVCAKNGQDWAGFFDCTLDQVNDALRNPAKTTPMIPADFALLVRKAWDMGTEPVIMQTSLQIDGDVVTRMSPSVLGEVAGKAVYSDASRLFIRNIHHEALESATRQWQSLFQLVSALIGGLADRVFTRK
ncbi:MAG: hypothetical protein AB7O80_13015 [Acetobacteraceae bacterium]